MLEPHMKTRLNVQNRVGLFTGFSPVFTPRWVTFPLNIGEKQGPGAGVGDILVKH